MLGDYTGDKESKCKVTADIHENSRTILSATLAPQDVQFSRAFSVPGCFPEKRYRQSVVCVPSCYCILAAVHTCFVCLIGWRIGPAR
jgi:hypothetical protein